ncbi:SIS domain-containing protein [Lactovum miscens]|uniref:Tagatose-6-phosphate ketose/aldose isomerase n=1 Tax=Lactovum miscens TaxID=190387 RepID=A0A841C7B9_9LACT|nr:SIS domain-containing protein [Lactovum miscens]MBB5887289.1 tagatose-6-phosphate ketose/aldose isomerase [Lactovum miscens]
MFELSEEELKSKGANITVRETLGQPMIWRKAFVEYLENKSKIEDFLKVILSKHSYVRVIFTGAGSSQYIGDTVVKSLNELGDTKHYHFESIGSTDIVSAPQSVLEENIPTLLVSFARSGNSPESVAAVEIVEQYVRDSYQLSITCAIDGDLSKKLDMVPNAYNYVLPSETLDQGFAMTSSFSTMTLLATLIFSLELDEDKSRQVEIAARLAEDIFSREDEISNYLPLDVKRVVYVGSGPLAGLTREAQLKILELTAGQISTIFDSSMGLRHGPKSFINDKTSVFIFASNNDYTRNYDVDLYKEVLGDEIAAKVVLIGQNVEGFNYLPSENIHPAYQVFPAIAFAHVIALTASLNVGNTPDTPSVSGTVNRVVKGVKIHPLYRCVGRYSNGFSKK